ncbi:MaoC family dehydratase N-terminal domain-containing protein [Mycobacterium sp. CVI_P3]|uniref:MaoC family dehydratase N-terminal domain-containing protein n=1 Tax=Mycobacterium pinniadriaticum TaxID=2994102 RepID=A0ABT3SNY7_9MYCO|nr:MaoC family dehydratase N-terminal domain-containing protein [Mycobacterium pinniadriaticum]MCX2934465.1 MaoC family dehydratase N-terminal domain-containing protein [Mycobacterium pinniadriaticum]MCX2940888.1 MaoC family dehydratase N-terminal domain-containing protein [Mycobacterium pinniadriaticum]
MSGDVPAPGEKSFRFPVERGHILMFARALGDDNPVYFDEGHESTRRCGGLVAPPTFVAGAAQFDPEWPYRPRPGAEWNGSGRGPGFAPASSGGGTSLHAEQHYEFHVPLRPGDVLTVAREAGETWEKQSARGGTLRFSEEITRFVNQRGELAVTARRVRVVTERAVDQ